MRQLPRLVLALGSIAAVSGCTDEGNTCTTDKGVTTCGQFGRALYTADLGGADVAWPPVAVESGRIVLTRGNELIAVGSNGSLQTLRSLQGAASAPSADENGGLYVLSGAGGKAQVTVMDGSKQRWQADVDGQPAGTPPTLGKDHVYVATRHVGDDRLSVLDRATGKVLAQRNGASPAAVLMDGSVRFLTSPNGRVGFGASGAARYRSLAAESATGQPLWTYEDKDGLVDFAPGAAGETYVVTAGNHTLKRVSAAGAVEWSFTPDCSQKTDGTSCNVGAAPTVAGDTVYFPVWEERERQAVDPLYAISAADGKLRWTYDGFDTRQTEYAPYKTLSPSQAGDPMDKTHTTHHPAGRPVVAEDGTLYVSQDGAVSALNHQGKLQGVALYDAAAGEVHWTDTFVEPTQTWINPGVRPSPVLAPDGVLYVWDGATVRAFQTGKPAAKQAWIAPFGGPSNAGAMR